LGSSWKREGWVCPGPYPFTTPCLAISWLLLNFSTFKGLPFNRLRFNSLAFNDLPFNRLPFNSLPLNRLPPMGLPAMGRSFKDLPFKAPSIKFHPRHSRGRLLLGSAGLARGCASRPAWPWLHRLPATTPA